ncbi:MAG: hypothetical protein HGB08_01250 [Candidatus Moranbacteria bacterium]|nr:hypothetical protein [Candidatus Moranbacteria bacterium]
MYYEPKKHTFKKFFILMIIAVTLAVFLVIAIPLFNRYKDKEVPFLDNNISPEKKAEIEKNNEDASRMTQVLKNSNSSDSSAQQADALTAQLRKAYDNKNQ